MTNKTQEIERRWVVKSFDPDVFRPYITKHIMQGYIDKNLRVRITDRAGYFVDPAELTLKTGRGLVRGEETTEISVEAAEMLLASTKYVIEKTRHWCDGWELDVFHGKLAGLVMLERECRTPEEAAALKLPSFIHSAIEVTETVTNRQLAKMAYYLDGTPDEAVRDLMLKPMPARIVLTGAPCSGKSTALRALKKVPMLHTVPETATIVMGQIEVLPTIGRMNFQTTIRKVQTSFEDAALKQASIDGKKGVIFDRGTLDSAAFIGGKEVYESMFRTSENEDFSRYDAIIMMALPSKEVFEREKSNNPVRRETYEEALVVQDALRTIWRGHPRFIYINVNESWEAKFSATMEAVGEVLAENAKRD